MDGGLPPAANAAPPLRGGGALPALLRHWRWTLACGLVCGAFAWVVGDRFKQSTWQAEGTMIYTPLALPENQKSVYSPPNLETLTNLMKSTSNLEKLTRISG